MMMMDTHELGMNLMDDSAIVETPETGTIDSEVVHRVNEPAQVVFGDDQRVGEVLRKSEQIKKQPKHLEHYVTDLPKSTDHSQPITNSETSKVYPLANFVSYERFSHNHKAFLAAITSHDEPKFFSQAVKDPMWCEAMKKEIKALEENGTWTLETLPPGKKTIDSMFTKLNTNLMEKLSVIRRAWWQRLHTS